MINIDARYAVARLNDVVVTNISNLIRSADYEKMVEFHAYCTQLHADIKFLSEVLTCLHFSCISHPLSEVLIDRIRRILLHPYMLQSVRINPLLGNWLLNAVALLQDRFTVTREREFILKVIDRFGLHTLDGPNYRLEENKYLLAKLKRTNYTPLVDHTYEHNFYRLSRDQVYALTHLLFYVSDYGTSRYNCSQKLRFGLEHLIYDACLNQDIDLMLELMLVYRACKQSENNSLALFETLLLKMIANSSQMMAAMTKVHSEHFATYYHQCLLAVMYTSTSKPLSSDSTQPDPRTFRSLRAAHAFHVSLRSANYVKAARRFIALPKLEPSRLNFCRDNFERYLALQRHDLGLIHCREEK